MSEFKPSLQQAVIFDNVQYGEGHTVVEALAGTGKTTTIIEAMKLLPKNLRNDCLLVAFNKNIAKELQERAPQGVEVSTLHSYGLRQISRALSPRPQVDEEKLRPILQEVVGNQDSKRFERGIVKRLVTLSKSTLAKTDEDVDELIDRYNVDLPEAESEKGASELRAQIVSETREVVAQSLEVQSVVDFDDMIYFPCIFKMTCSQSARVFVDETQDLNESQIKLALKSCDSSGRILAVGDKHQAIYGFRGAASGAMDVVINRLDAEVLDLTVTRRCPKAVVRLAREYVPKFEAPPDAPEGLVASVYRPSPGFDPQPGDFVLSRTNAPLIPLCFGFLRRGVRASIQGRDIGSRLRGLIIKMRADSVPELATKVLTWRDREIERLTKLERDTTSVFDTSECIHALSEGAASVDEILGRVDRLFADDGRGDLSKIMLSTTHKAKGLERDRVWIMRDTYLKARPIKGEWQVTQEERSLFYVAVTRSKKELYLVCDEQS